MGEEDSNYPLPHTSSRYLADLIGQGEIFPDASIEQGLSLVPKTRLLPHSLIATEPIDRLLHARGQSLPDWIALRLGQIGTFPDGVAYPTDEKEVWTLIEDAQKAGIKLIPYGGGTK